MDLWMMDGKILGCVRILVVGYWLWTDLVVCTPRMKVLGFLLKCISIACFVAILVGVTDLSFFHFQHQRD